MKKLLFILLTIISLSTFAQNGGMSNENNTTRLDWVGYQSAQFHISITNKRICTNTYLVNWQGKDTLFVMQGLQTRQILLPATKTTNDRIRVRPTNASECTGNDMGWVEVFSPIDLPVKFSYFAVKKLDPETLAIIFTTYETENVKYFHVTVSDDGKTWRKVAIVMPYANNANGTYTAKLKIKNLKQ